jgi:hypothetical protein
MEDFRKTAVACYDQGCIFNVGAVPEPTCALKLIGIGIDGKCTSRRPRKKED